MKDTIQSAGWQNSFVSKLPGEEDTKTAGRIAIGCLVVEIDGFEPTTPCLQSRCSSQLSYTPIADAKVSKFS